MSISFSRSTRSINNDSFRTSVIALVIALVIFGAWSLWFVFAQVVQFESSTDWQIQRDGSILAKYSPEAMSKIFPGQNARLSLRVSGKPVPVDVPAVVMDIPSGFSNRLVAGTVRIAVLVAQLPAGYEGGEVQIQVERLTPFQLILRASNRTIGLQFPNASSPK